MAYSILKDMKHESIPIRPKNESTIWHTRTDWKAIGHGSNLRLRHITPAAQDAPEPLH